MSGSQSFVKSQVGSMARDALDYIDTRSRQWRQTIPEHVRQTTQAVLADDDDERERRSPQLARRRFVKELARINKRQCLFAAAIGCRSLL